MFEELDGEMGRTPHPLAVEVVLGDILDDALETNGSLRVRAGTDAGEVHRAARSAREVNRAFERE